MYTDHFVYLCVALAQRPDVAVQAAPHGSANSAVASESLPRDGSYLFLATVQVLIGTSPALGVFWRSCLCSNVVTSCHIARELLVLICENMPVFFHFRILQRIKETLKTVDDWPNVRDNARTRLQAATVSDVVVKIMVAPATNCHLQRN